MPNKYKVMNMSTQKVEECWGDTDQEVIDSYKIMGVDVKIMGMIDMDTPQEFNGELPPGIIPTPQGVPQSQRIPTPPAQPQMPKEIKFKVMGTEVKLMPDGVYVKEWVDLEDGEYKVVSKKTGKESKDYNVQIKDWVKSEDE
jgi:hypothetical protein